MKRVLLLAAISEAATGSALLIVPSLVGRLLLGQELAGVAIPVARVLGIALIALGVACWSGGSAHSGMMTYSVLATGYLAWLGIRGDWVGSLLWPAVVLHAAITVLLGHAWKHLNATCCIAGLQGTPAQTVENAKWKNQQNVERVQR